MFRTISIGVLCLSTVSFSKAHDTDTESVLRKDIQTKVDSATSAYDKGLGAARGDIVKLLEQTVRSATSRGDIQGADSASRELKNFLVNDQKPTLVTTTRFEMTREKGMLRLIGAHEVGVRRFTQAGMLEDARTLREVIIRLRIRKGEPPLKGTLDRQLLVNPGGEKEAVNNRFVGWRIIKGGWKRSLDNPDPKTGQGSFASLGARTCVLTQNVKVEDLENYIDASTITFQLTGEIWRLQKSETGSLTIDCLNEKGRVIESSFSPIALKVGQWQSVAVEGPVPKGTRAVQVYLFSRMTVKGKGRAANVWYDNLDLRLKKRSSH